MAVCFKSEKQRLHCGENADRESISGFPETEVLFSRSVQCFHQSQQFLPRLRKVVVSSVFNHDLNCFCSPGRRLTVIKEGKRRVCPGSLKNETVSWQIDKKDLPLAPGKTKEDSLPVLGKSETVGVSPAVPTLIVLGVLLFFFVCWLCKKYKCYSYYCKRRGSGTHNIVTNSSVTNQNSNPPSSFTNQNYDPNAPESHSEKRGVSVSGVKTEKGEESELRASGSDQKGGASVSDVKTEKGEESELGASGSDQKGGVSVSDVKTEEGEESVLGNMKKSGSFSSVDLEAVVEKGGSVSSLSDPGKPLAGQMRCVSTRSLVDLTDPDSGYLQEAKKDETVNQPGTSGSVRASLPVPPPPPGGYIPRIYPNLGGMTTPVLPISSLFGGGRRMPFTGTPVTTGSGSKTVKSTVKKRGEWDLDLR